MDYTYITESKTFIILVGGPGLYDGKDKEHDKAWYNYINPVMVAAKNGQLSKANEKLFWLVYEPAYRKRWEEDNKEPSLFEEYIYDSDLSVTRYEHTRKVICAGAKNYIDYMKIKAKTYTSPGSSPIEVVEIASGKDFWDFLKKQPDKSVSRVWYLGHAAEDLWLTVYHDDNHKAIMYTSYTAEYITPRDIAANASLKAKFAPSSLPSKFYGCNTALFAQTWNSVFGIPAEGAEGKVNFNKTTLADIELSATGSWKKFPV